MKSLLLLPLALLPVAGPAAEPLVATPAVHAPPAPPPILRGTAVQLRAAALAAPAATGTLYSIGEPTDDEQYYLELINRARATPAAEGIRLATTTDADVLAAYAYFGVDLAMMQSEFAALPVRPPLALNALLTQSARGHTADLYTNAFQGHVGTDGRTLGQRVTATGYTWTTLGENVYSYADSTWAGHAGFEVDWGGTAATGGMQSPRGHRNNIHGDFREVGIGVFFGTNTVNGNTVGPQLVTQDFGSSSQVFVTGVAYYDLDGDGFYDPGEGVGGLTVEVSGASFHAVTSASGGYAVPVPFATATRTVTFTGPDLGRSTAVALTSGLNAKVDCTAAYQPPVVSGSATPGVGISNTYGFTALGGATAHEWEYVRKTAMPADPADSLAGITAATSGGYAVIATDVKYSAPASYHLAHPSPPGTQLLTYPDALLAGPSGAFSFYSRLGWATTGQTAQVELSTDEGVSWQPVFTQAGTGGAGETGFTQRTVSLAAYAGRIVRLRFAYRFTTGSYYPATTAGNGWYIDQISFTDLSTLAAAVVAPTAAGRTFAFTPPNAGAYLLAVRPLTPGRVWPFGPLLEVTATLASPFATWAAQQEADAGLPGGTIAAHPDADYNGDGVNNLTAYALGLSATAFATPPAASASGNRLWLVYPRDSAKTDITIAPQISTDLTTWYDVGAAGAPAGFTDSLLSSTGTVQTHEASVPFTSGNRLFLRLRIVRP